jgi:hypothetical protein
LWNFFCCGNAESFRRTESAVRLYLKRMVALTKSRSNYMRKTDKNGQIFWGAHEFFWGINEIYHVPNKMSTSRGILFARNGKLNSPSQLGATVQAAIFPITKSITVLLPRRERSFGNSKRKRIFRKELFPYLPAKAISSSHDILSQMGIDSVTYSTLDIYTARANSSELQIRNRSPTKVSSTTK